MTKWDLNHFQARTLDTKTCIDIYVCARACVCADPT